MRRSVSAAALAVVASAILFLNSHAAEKAAKATAAASSTNADAREQVRQALLAETRGDNDERGRCLSQALTTAPDLPEANWHAARVRVEGQWLPLSQFAHRASCDPNLKKYRELRAKAAGAKALRDLARWCNKNDMPDVARLHYAQLLAAGNADAEMKQEAVKALDLQQVGGVLLTREEVEARQAEAKAVEKSLAKWRPVLSKLQPAIDGENYAARDRAIAELHKLSDPQIIPALESFLPEGGERFSEEVVKLLAKFPQYEATQALARYAVLSTFALTRDAATAELRKRPLHEYVPLLMGSLVAPLQSRYQVTWNRLGQINYVHAVAQEGPTHNRLLVAHQLATMHAFPSPPYNPSHPPIPGLSKSDAFINERASTADKAANAETEVRLTNAQADAANSRSLAALEGTTGRKYSTVSEWWDWWRQYNEYTWPRPTQYAYRSIPYTYYAGSPPYASGGSGNSKTIVVGPWAGDRSQPNFPVVARSCFLAGTPVRTQTGQVPIESIQPGDRVLSQDPDTGELTYKVVLTTTLRPPAEMLAIHIDGEKIVTTLGHPFWVTGHGWKMAKELKPGDLLHRLGGAVAISAIEPAPQAAAYNLVVDDFNTYFVGQSGLLVHDNEFRKPTRAIVPGLTIASAVLADSH